MVTDDYIEMDFGDLYIKYKGKDMELIKKILNILYEYEDKGMKVSLKDKIPSTKDVQRYIEEKGEYEHSILGVVKHFLGINVSYDRLKRMGIYHPIYQRIRNAQIKVEKREDGYWVGSMGFVDNKRTKIFVFI